MIVVPFLVSSNILKIFLFKKWTLADGVFSDSYIGMGRFQPI